LGNKSQYCFVVNKGRFTVENSSGSSKLSVIDVMGRIVFETDLAEKAKEFDLRLTAGAYYVRLTNPKGLGVKKIIVE
jgi:hypothetical protein